MSFDVEYWFLTPEGHPDWYKLGLWLMLLVVVGYGLYDFVPF